MPDSDYSHFTPKKVINIDRMDLMFWKHTSDIIIFSFIPSVLISILLKFLFYFCKGFLSSNSGIRTSVVRSFSHISSLKMLFVSIMESSLAFLAFNCGLQLLQPGFFNFYDKLNMLLTYIFFFISLLYALSFYIIVYSTASRGRAERFLTYSKNDLSGFILESMLIATRNFVNGFIHGYLLYNYTVQMSCLLASKLLTVIILFVLRKSFAKKTYFMLFEAYFLLGCIIDTLLLINYYYDEIFFLRISMFEVWILIILSCLVGLIILMQIFF